MSIVAVPSVNVDAVPAAAPRLITSSNGIPRSRARTIAATAESPAPTVLFASTLGGIAW